MRLGIGHGRCAGRVVDIGQILLFASYLGAHAGIARETGRGSALISTTIVTVSSGAMIILVV